MSEDDTAEEQSDEQAVEPEDPNFVRLHATCVSVDGKGALLIGAAGSGKSAVALAMVALGATLVADDQTELRRNGDTLIANCPEGYEGWIEARGIGILRVPHTRDIPVTVVIDMDQTELHRLPNARRHEILGLPCDLVLGRDNWGLVSGVMALLRGGRV